MAKRQPFQIVNWEDYQHYSKRRPPWIKFYTSLLDNHEMSQLRASSRLLAPLLLLVAARTDNAIPNDIKWLSNALQMNAVQIEEGLADLLRIGFVKRKPRYQDASNVLAKRYSKAEAEKRRDKGSSVARPPARARVEQTAKKNSDKIADEHAFSKLLAVIPDADDKTEATLRRIYSGLPVAALGEARDRVTENGVRSPAKLAAHVGKELRERYAA